MGTVQPGRFWSELGQQNAKAVNAFFKCFSTDFRVWQLRTHVASGGPPSPCSWGPQVLVRDIGTPHFHLSEGADLGNDGSIKSLLCLNIICKLDPLDSGGDETHGKRVAPPKSLRINPKTGLGWFGQNQGA